MVDMHDGARMPRKQLRTEPHRAVEANLVGDERNGYQSQLLIMPPTHAQPCLPPTFELGLAFPIPGLGHGPISMGEAKA